MDSGKATKLVQRVAETAITHYRVVNEQTRLSAATAERRERLAVTKCLAALLDRLPSEIEVALALRGF